MSDNRRKRRAGSGWFGQYKNSSFVNIQDKGFEQDPGRGEPAPFQRRCRRTPPNALPDDLAEGVPEGVLGDFGFTRSKQNVVIVGLVSRQFLCKECYTGEGKQCMYTRGIVIRQGAICCCTQQELLN